MKVIAAEDLPQVLWVLSDPARLHILTLLRDHPEGCTVTAIQDSLGRLKQPTVSHHLRLLLKAGLVDRRQRSVHAFYTLARGLPRFVTETLKAAHPSPPKE